MSFSLRTLGAAVASALLFSTVHAAGLGKLTVLSSLGQPLRAEIELSSADQEEAASLVAKLAPTDAYRQAKIDFNPVLLSLRFAIVQRGERQVISLTSTQPINEPFVDVLLELGGNKGRLIREYTFLLDPVDLRLSRNTQVVTPMAVPVAPVATAPVSESLRQERGTPANNSVTRSGSRAIEAKKSSTYKVKSGDTLTQIALKFKPEGISLDQMLVALYRANPDGFASNNMNRMRTGTVLSVPDSNTTSSVAPSVASAVVVAQAADFNAYRNQLAGKIARDAAKSSATNAQNAQSAVGKIETKVEETQANVSESKDKLQISKADAVAGSAAGMANGVAPTGENAVAAEKALEEATARIQILEKNLSDLQQLLEIKNKALTEQQLNVQTAESAQTVKAVPLAKPVTPAPAPLAKPGFFDQLLDNPLFLPGAGLLFALLGALGIYSTRRRKKPVNKFGDSAFAASSLQTNSLFGSTGGQSVDTNNSVFNSSFAPSASQLDTNEVDPVAEADVYIAYGRDAQAEEILKEALRTQPDRHPVRLKLLEIYANRKDLRSFEMLASELYGMTKGETDEWHQAARLGAVLDPNNPLYAGGALPEEDALKTAVLGAPTLPLEELDPEALLNNSTSHVGVDSDAAEFAFETIETIEAAPAIEPKPDPAESTDLTPDYLAEAENSISSGLDFDLGEMDDFAPEPDVAAVKDAKEKESDDSSLDFIAASLDEPALSEKTTEAGPVSIFPKFDLDEINFDLPGSPATDKADAVQVAQPSLADPTQDALPVMDIAPEAEPEAKAEAEIKPETEVEPETETETPAEPAAPSLEFDLSGFDLDFDPVEPPSASASDALIDNLAQSDAALGDVEMSTKLDLAVAYQEIGDKEGARELLEEVLLDGSSAQIEKARTMLAELV